MSCSYMTMKALFIIMIESKKNVSGWYVTFAVANGNFEYNFQLNCTELYDTRIASFFFLWNIRSFVVSIVQRSTENRTFEKILKHWKIAVISHEKDCRKEFFHDFNFKFCLMHWKTQSCIQDLVKHPRWSTFQKKLTTFSR